MLTLRRFVLTAAAVLAAAVPAVAAEKARKKQHAHHTFRGVIEKVEHKEHEIVVKLHHEAARTTETATAQKAKRGSKKKHAEEVTLHVGKETTIHVHDGKKKHEGSFASLKDGEHVVVHASGHEAKDIDVEHHKRGAKK